MCFCISIRMNIQREMKVQCILSATCLVCNLLILRFSVGSVGQKENIDL